MSGWQSGAAWSGKCNQVKGPDTSTADGVPTWADATGRLLSDNAGLTYSGGVLTLTAGNVSYALTYGPYWGADTRIYTGVGVDLYVDAADDLYLRPDDDLLICMGGSQYARFDGGDQSLHVDRIDDYSGGVLTYNASSYHDLKASPATGGARFYADSTLFASLTGGATGSRWSFGLRETSAVDSVLGGWGSFWVKNTSPNVPMFRDDSNTDHYLYHGVGGSDHQIVRFDGSGGNVGRVQGSNATIDDSGNLTISGYIATADGGADNAVKIGDDCWLRDVDVANCLSIQGAQNAALANVQLSSGGPNLYANGSGVSICGSAFAPSYMLDVRDSAAGDFVARFSNSYNAPGVDVVICKIGTTTTTLTNHFVQFQDSAGNAEGYIRGQTDGTGVQYDTASDLRLKQDVRDAVPGLLDRAMGLRVREWTWRSDGRPGIGLIAQEVEPFWPLATGNLAEAEQRNLDRHFVRYIPLGGLTEETAALGPDAMQRLRTRGATILEERPLEEGDPGWVYHGIDYGRLTPLLVGALQEEVRQRREEADGLRTQLDTIREEMDALRAEVDALRQRVSP